MNIELFASIEDELESDSRYAAKTILEAYCGSESDFFRLFYQPVWSFLHWLKAYVPQHAIRAQSLALFLHLWDDHLSDGQLVQNDLSGSIRDIAWQSFEFSARASLSESLGISQQVFERHVTEYVTSTSTCCAIDGLDSYCAHFRRQIAIWTLIPFVVGYRAGGMRAAQDLKRIIELFSIAWRLVDDLEDIEEDIVAGTHSSVYLLFDREGREVWDSCHVQRIEEGIIDDMSWQKLDAQMQRCKVDEKLSRAISGTLYKAAAFAERHAWIEIANELRESMPRQ